MAFEKVAIENATAVATGEVCHGEKKYIVWEMLPIDNRHRNKLFFIWSCNLGSALSMIRRLCPVVLHWKSAMSFNHVHSAKGLVCPCCEDYSDHFTQCQVLVCKNVIALLKPSFLTLIKSEWMAPRHIIQGWIFSNIAIVHLMLVFIFSGCKG